MSEFNEWREAVFDACACAWVGWNEADPRATLQRLIAWHEKLALDPLVSEGAAALAVQPALPADLVREIEWAIENGNTGPRSHDLLVNIRAAIGDDRYTLTDAGRAALGKGK